MSVTTADILNLLNREGLLVRWAGSALENIGVEPFPSFAVTSCAIDSRAAEPGSIFICKGAAFKPAYLGQACARGAVCWVADEGMARTLASSDAAKSVPGIVVTDIRRAMATLPPLVLGHPERALEVVGITGTKGKSTVAYMLRSILRAAGDEASILGSIETDDGAERFESHNTTPEAPDLWRHLANTARSGRRRMVMEVSSQALKYDRTLGLTFDIGCFLNIGRDHISPVEHPDFEDYFASKLRLFGQCRTAVVNLGSDHADRVLAAARHAHEVVTFGVDRADADVRAENVVGSGEGYAFDLVYQGERNPVRIGMTGAFNVDNALAAATIALVMGIDVASIARGLAEARVPGRMELFWSADRRVMALVDYAHNPLSFEALFSSMKREHPNRAIVAVFGAPGDKALERRQQLPAVAGRYADLIIYTEEDPAHERVEDICAELAAATPPGTPYLVVPDRTEAVERALAWEPQPGAPTCVLLLAKGDETRQHRGDAFPEVESDTHIAQRVLNGA